MIPPPARRLLARVRREVPVWGLVAPARVWRSEGMTFVDCDDPADAHLARGFADAAAGMPAMDLARRLWSGRLAELLGERRLAGCRAPEVDLFVRTLGFRRDAELAYRRAPQPEALDDYARGANAWIDAGLWRGAPAWDRWRTQPRLWSAADTLLVHRAPAQVDSAGDLLLVDPSARGSWPGPWDGRLRALWGALHHRALRAPGAPGGPLDGWDPEVPDARAAPRIVPVMVLPGGDNNRALDPSGAVCRLRARRQDLAVRGGPALHPWIRSGPQGPLVSDLLRGAFGRRPPAGPAFAWGWPPASGFASPRSRPPLEEPLVPPSPPELPTIRLVPLEGGA